jgi:hypothetical protein
LPYSFIYDLTRISHGVFEKLIDAAYSVGLHKLIGENAKRLVKIFKIDEATGLNVAEAITLVEDLIEVQIENKLERGKFEKANHKALLIPHCVRAFMDRRCMAHFEAEVPTYKCQKCNENCTVNKATSLGEKNGYDVYVIPGGSCAEKILRSKNYEGVVGVACGQELKMSIGLLKKLKIAGQGVFLTKNGCANTNLNLESLQKVL